MGTERIEKMRAGGGGEVERRASSEGIAHRCSTPVEMLIEHKRTHSHQPSCPVTALHPTGC